MGELLDRRARKKAQTRELIRSVAQQLFDQRGFETVTIADIARECDVAVQTVFNHFATKEELFFDGRTPWVDTLADSVRQRDPSVSPLSALRAHLEGNAAPPGVAPSVWALHQSARALSKGEALVAWRHFRRARLLEPA